MKKRLLAGLMASCMLAGLAGCGGNAPSSSTGSSTTGSSATSTPAGGDASAPSESTPSEASGDTIKIGGLAPLTGVVAQYGEAVNNAILLAVEDINKNGGINGQQIEYVCYDEKGDVTEALNAYNKLVSEGVVAIIGDVTSKPSIAVAEKAAGDFMPLISASATASEVTEAGENVFRACFIDPFQGQLMASYAKNKLSATSAAILYDSADAYSSGIADAFEAAAAENGITITTKESYQSGDVDFNAQLTKIKEGSPDVLMVPVYYSDVALIAKSARDMGITSKLLGADGWDGVLEQDATVADALVDSYFCSQYSAESTDENLQAFLKRYKEAYGKDANMFAVLGYDAMNIMAQAIQTAGSTDAQAIVDALKATNYSGLTGVTTFDENRNPVREAIILTIADGNYKYVENYKM